MKTENVFQDQPMKNIVFDGVRVLQAANSDLEKYHTCKGGADKNLEKVWKKPSKIPKTWKSTTLANMGLNEKPESKNNFTVS